MMIVDDNAESTLAGVLESLKEKPGTACCIHLSLEGMIVPPLMMQIVITSAKQHISCPETHLFQCKDGDIFLLSPTIHHKEYRAFAEQVSAQTHMPASANWMNFYELSVHMNRLLYIVEQKVDKIRARNETEARKHALTDAEHKRSLMFEVATHISPEDIHKRRMARSSNELMIIEDDAFSRKLVENVLGKHYHLTGLGDAHNALETYARLAPDILFLDIDLPDVTGHELLKLILTIDPKAYVIMLSGNADRENILHAISLGARGFIGKPFTREKLLQYIERCSTITH